MIIVNLNQDLIIIKIMKQFNIVKWIYRLTNVKKNTARINI